MLKIFQSNRAIVLILIPVLIFIYFALNFYFGYHVSEEEMNLGLWGKYKNKNIIFSFVSLFLVGAGAVLLNRVYNKNAFTEKNNFLPSLFYVLFLSSSHSFYFLDGLSLAQIFIILSVIQLFKLNQKEDGRKTVFNAGFFFGLACTFYPILFFGWPFLLFIIWISRPFIFREATITIAGIIIPSLYAICLIVVFNIDIDLTAINTSSKEVLIFDTIFCISTLVLFFFFGLKKLFSKLQTGSIRIKKIIKILFFLVVLFFFLFLVDVIYYKKTQSFILMVIPFVLILPYAFRINKLNIIPTILFYLFFVFLLSKFFIPYHALIFS